MELFKALEIYGKVRHKIWEKGHYLTRKMWGNIVDEYGNDWLVDFSIANDNDWKAYREILTDRERKYLSAVIRPFRDRVKYIYKANEIDDCSQLIFIYMERYDYEENLRCEYMGLPHFKKDTMYKGMETGKKYTLADLGLDKEVKDDNN